LYGAGTAPNFLGGNTTISRNQNATTSLTISNTTAGTSSYTELILQQDASAGLGAVGKMSSISNPAGIITSSNTYLYNGTAGDIAIYNAFATGKIKFSAGAVTTPQMTLTAAGRLLLGTTTESSFLLDVNGTARVSGDMTVSKNQNAGTRFDVINTISGTGSYAEYRIQTGTGSASLGKFSGTTTAYKFISANDSYFSNFANGDIAFLNDFATGNIKFAAGGSSTAHLTIESTGKVSYAASTTAKAQINLASGTAPTSPVNGDIWFDGTDLKMRIGGVTKTFTLV
jgi:putative sterol carrier protein